MEFHKLIKNKNFFFSRRPGHHCQREHIQHLLEPDGGRGEEEDEPLGQEEFLCRRVLTQQEDEPRFGAQKMRIATKCEFSCRNVEKTPFPEVGSSVVLGRI